MLRKLGILGMVTGGSGLEMVTILRILELLSGLRVLGDKEGVGG